VEPHIREVLDATERRGGGESGPVRILLQIGGGLSVAAYEKYRHPDRIGAIAVTRDDAGSSVAGSEQGERFRHIQR
jgi:hypothetical protein